MMNHTAIVKLKASLEESRAPVHAKVENPNNLIVESVSEDGRTDVMSDVRDEPGIVATPYENNTQDSMGAFRMHYGATAMGKSSHSRTIAQVCVDTGTPPNEQALIAENSMMNDRAKTKPRAKEPIGNDKTIDTNVRGSQDISNEILDFDGSQVSSAERLSMMKHSSFDIVGLKNNPTFDITNINKDQTLEDKRPSHQDMYYSQTAAVSQNPVEDVP